MSLKNSAKYFLVKNCRIVFYFLIFFYQNIDDIDSEYFLELPNF